MILQKVKEKIIIVFGILLIFLMITILARFSTKNIIVDTLGISNDFTNFILQGMDTSDAVDEVTGELLVDIAWSELYPFESDSSTEKILEKNSVNNNTFQLAKKLLNTWNGAVKKLTGSLAQYCNEFLYKRIWYVENAYVYENIIGWDILPYGGSEGIVNLEEGYLSYAMNEKDVEPLVERMMDFQQFLNQENIPLLYVQAPSKLSPEGEELPAGVSDYSNDTIKKMVEGLEKAGIDTFNCTEWLMEQPEEYHDLFYKTDHHWTTETAFRIAGAMAEYLNEEYQFEFPLEYYKEDKYEIDYYEKWFLGSLGKKLTLAVVEPEDYQVYVPNFETDFSIKIPERNIDLTGSFKDVILDYRHLQKKDYYGENMYASFMNRNDALGSITNNLAPTNKGKRILFIKDSYSTPVIPYLALGVEHIDSIYEQVFDGSIRTYIKETKPDMVVVMYAVNSVTGDGSSHISFFNLE